MSYTVLGNNSNPLNNCLVEQYYEEDDDNIIYMQGELVEEQDCVGYRATLSKASNSTTVELGYYYRRPMSVWYWEYAWDEDCKPVIPVVFACNSSWTITQCLNANFTAYPISNRNNGWFTVSLTLTRKLNKNEKIFFGFYSDLHCPVWSGGAVNNCWYNYTSARRHLYNSAIAYVSSAEYISQNGWYPPDYNFCVYLKYEDAVESVAYTRSVGGTVGALTSNTRKAWWKRSLNPGGNISSSLTRKAVWKRNESSSGLVSSAAYRSNHLKLSFSDSKIIVDGADKRIIFFRNIENVEEVSARNFRAAHLKITKAESSDVTDLEHSLLLLMRSVASGGGFAADLNHKADYKRLHASLVDDEEEITHSGENYRGFSDELDVDALPFASRLFFRTVQTVMGLWDWLRGKIREANNVVTLYCPIWTEVEFECPI